MLEAEGHVALGVRKWSLPMGVGIWGQGGGPASATATPLGLAAGEGSSGGPAKGAPGVGVHGNDRKDNCSRGCRAEGSLRKGRDHSGGGQWCEAQPAVERGLQGGRLTAIRVGAQVTANRSGCERAARPSSFFLHGGLTSGGLLDSFASFTLWITFTTSSHACSRTSFCIATIAGS